MLALAVIAWSERGLIWGGIAVAVSVQVNAHFVQDRFGDLLENYGLGGWQVLAIGLSLSTLMLLALREISRSPATRRFVDRAGGVLGSLVLVALLADFFARGALAGANSYPLVAGALMACLAVCAMRQLKFDVPCQAAQSVAIWSAAFSIPILQSYGWAVFGLFLPAAYFWWQMERHPVRRDSFRRAALSIAVFVAGFGAVKELASIVLFAGMPLPDRWYHFGAPTLLLTGLLMCRCRSVAGVPVMMVASFFCATAVPGWSPFLDITVSAWVAIVLGHLWIAASNLVPARLTKYLKDSGSMVFLVAMTHIVIGAALWLGGLVSHNALMLLGGGSVILHIAFLLRRSWLHMLGAGEVLAALYLEPDVGGFVNPDTIVWILLGIWLANLLFYDRFVRLASPRGRNYLPIALGVLVMGEILFAHGPDSWIGLGAFAIGSLMAAATRVSPAAQKPSLLLATAPVWLVYFGSVNLFGDGGAVLPILLALLVAMALAEFALRIQNAPEGGYAGRRLVDLLFAQLRQSGATFGAILSGAVLPMAVAVHALQWSGGGPFTPNQLMALLLVYVASAVFWMRHGHFLPRLAVGLILQICVLLTYHALRTQLVLTTDIWQPSYDVWATLLGAFIVAGCRELPQLADWQSRASLAISLWSMPAAGLAMVWANQLGADTALLVIGVQSIVFGYSGRDAKESPYNAVAIFGFVAFVLMLFWTKFEFRVLHAFVVPAGLGVLALVQLFHRLIPAAARNVVRLFTLLSMIGSTGYSALLDDRYPVVFHVTMLVLCLACMGLGSLLRVRLYLYLGFTGLVVNLGSITYKVLGSMERGSRMTTIGSLVLVGGIAILAAAIYYKTHRGAMNEVIRRMRGRLAAWE